RPIGLLLVRHLDHVDLALEPDQLAGEGKCTPPLTGARLRRQSRAPFLLVVVRLRDGRVRLVASRRADAFVFVEDRRVRADRMLESASAIQRRRAPEAVDLEY